MSTQRIGGAPDGAPQHVAPDIHENAGDSGAASASCASQTRSTSASGAKRQLLENMVVTTRRPPIDQAPPPGFAGPRERSWGAEPSATRAFPNAWSGQPAGIPPTARAMRPRWSGRPTLLNRLMDGLQRRNSMRDTLRQFRLTLLQSLIETIKHGMEVMKKASEPPR